MRLQNLLLLILLAPFSNHLYASIEDYIYPYSSPSFNDYGTLGLIRMPSARFHEAGTIAFNWSDHEPYTRGSIVAYPFDWLEASYQYTDVNNALYSDVASFSGNQTYKDKGFDVKLRLMQETSLWPSVAIGIRDIAGTGTFAAEYLVASKKLDVSGVLWNSKYISDIDFTMGLGWGDLSYNKFKNPLTNISNNFNKRTIIKNTEGGEFSPGRYFSGPMGVFAGIEVPLPNLHGLRFKLEYDATDYEEEGFAFGRESFSFAFDSVKQSQSRLNVGFVYPLNHFVQLYGAFTKGNTFSIGFSLQAGLAPKKTIVKKNDPYIPINGAVLYKELSNGDDDYMMITVMRALRENNIFLQKANRDGEELTVLYAQGKYMSHGLATGRAARALDEVAPDYITKFNFQNINAGMIMNEIQIDRESFHKYKEYKFHNLASKNIKIKSKIFDDNDYQFNPEAKYPNLFWSIEPDLRSQIGGPDGFYFGDLRLAFKSEFQIRRNLSLITDASVGIYNNFDELKLASDSILPHVRTDIVKYFKATEDFSLKRMQLNYFHKPFNNVFAKISVGLIEEMFGGVGGEVIYRPMDQNFAIGAEIWSLKQRDYDMKFKFLDYQTETGHINFYYREPRSNVTIALKGGKFLAGDSGINFDFSRRYKSGLRIGAFFSLTDISKREFGEGSFDKGFYFTIPIQTFFSNYRRNLAAWGLKPLTRDGAAYVLHSHHLWGLTEPAQAYGISRDFDDIYD